MTEPEQNEQLHLEKHLQTLKQPANRAKNAIIDALEKSDKRFKEEADKLESSSEQKKRLLKKLEKISSNLVYLKNLSEDDVITFAFQTQGNLMAVAANRRLPAAMRLKAQVASRKPLSTHLNRLKRKLQSAEVDEVKDEPSKTLDKICVNKQIVLMRKDVKRAKVHIIHKLTRQIQMLRRSKCTGEKKEKLEKKADRFVKKIKYIREFEPDDISRFALTSTQDLNKMSNDIKWPLKTQAMATVAIHKFVAEPVANFKNTFPDAYKKVPAILKKKKKKRKLNIETKDSINVSKQSVDKAKSDSEGSQNEEDNEEEEEQRDHSEEESGRESRSGEDDESVLDEESNNEESEDINKDSVMDEDVASHSESDSSSHEQPIAKKKIDEKIGINPEVKIKSFKDTPIKMKINHENKHANPKITKKNNKIIQKKLSPKLSEKKPTAVDPFFVTASNEEYVTAQVPSVGENDSKWEDSSSFKPNRFDKVNMKSKWSKRDDRWTNNKFQNRRDIAPSRKPFTDRFEKIPKSTNSNNVPNIFANRKERRKALHQPVQEQKIEKLHPSWEAKKKQTGIANFQGKKIVFD